MSNYLQRSCSDAIRFFHDSAKVSKIIATIQVSGSDAVTSNTKTSSPNIIDILGIWIKQTIPWIPWIIISALLIGMFGVLMWRKHVTRVEGGGGLSFKTEINIVSAITLGLIILTIYIFFQQQFVTYLIVIGIVILIYFGIKAGIFKGDGGSRNGGGGVSGLAEIYPIPNGVRNYIAPGGKSLCIYKVFKNKSDATKYVIFMKKKYGNSYAFQKWSSKTYEYGIVWGVYSDFR